MIQTIKSYKCICDNCGELYEHWHSGFSLYSDESTLVENMEDSGWYTGYTDANHIGNHYCPKCFKADPVIDDKIILSLDRMKVKDG